ncbi:Clr5 domain-containing protein [Aspergillus neoniger CBS 115656]|uniref:Clr5 domain-containing protein n=1 Tax=Aspergillus neoniger (strain CBS 115656) TaxID=1448310 RepID=A0A318YYJ8_ASPNB|nr:hypothetical protein BO87DRAFT_411643 [Aspergillus neoniger CBS 115656]PYH39659.1 hypothetical protein BO87DRAFT_411643 [Aspergillus neoniger CBS 115656]
MSSNDAEWSKHKKEVSSLYRKNPLNRVMKHMIAKHGFHRKESEYKKKLKVWGVRKNGTTSAWVFVQREVTKRKLQGNEDYEVLMHGKIYTAKQAEREMARHVTSATNFALEGENDTALEGVEVPTPRLMLRSLVPTREVRTDNLPWILFKYQSQFAVVRSFSTPAANVDMLNLPFNRQSYSQTGPLALILRGMGGACEVSSVNQTNVFDLFLQDWVLQKSPIDSSIGNTWFNLPTGFSHDPPSIFYPILQDGYQDNRFSGSRFDRSRLSAPQPVGAHSALTVIQKLSIQRHINTENQQIDLHQLTGFLKQYEVKNNGIESSLLSRDLGGLDNPSHLRQVFNTFVFLITNDLMNMDDITRVF